jgi:uncharacterized membrane protein
MTILILGLVLFLGMHSVSIFALNFRNAMVARSELGWKAFYGIISLVGLWLIVRGYAEARLTTTMLYYPPTWLRHLSATLMLPMFVFFFAPYFPGRIKATLKHPQLVAVKLWAFAHLLVNGTVADLVLFGSFLAWAVVDRISLKRRPARDVPGAPPGKFNDLIVVVLGLAAYIVFALHLHARWIGVAPFG